MDCLMQNKAMDVLGTSSLLDVGEDPISHVMSFLDARDLALVEATASSMQKMSRFAWNILAQQVTDLSPRVAKTPKERATIFYKAQTYSEKMRRVALQHYNLDDPDRCRALCRGCKNIKSLNCKVFRHPERYDFVLRFTTRKESISSTDHSIIIWEGIVGAVRMKQALNFDMSQISSPERSKSMLTSLNLRNEPANTHSSDAISLGLLAEAVDNLMLTVSAVERTTGIATLVVATGGFNSFSTPDLNQIICFLNPRNASPHSIRRDEDWIQVGLHITSHPCRITGVSVCKAMVRAAG